MSTLEESGGHEAFMEALGGAPQPEPQSEPTPQGGEKQGDGQNLPAQDGGEQPQPEPAPQPEPQVRQQEQIREPPPGWVPQWRLNEMAEERRRLAAEAAELRQWRQEREEAERRQKAEAELQGQNLWEAQDPNAFIDQRFQHRAEQMLTPVQRAMQEMQESMRQQAADFSHQMAVQQHGADKVQTAYQRVQQAIAAGDPTALQLQARVQDPRDRASRDPTGAILMWDRNHSILTETGGDLAAYRDRTLDEALKDPAFLARALEAHRQVATPVQTGVPGRAPPPQSRGSMPSVNRMTSSRDDADVGGTAADVFMEEIAARGRPPGR